MKNLVINSMFKGSLVVLPLLVTAWLIWSAISWLDGLGLKVFYILQIEHIGFPGLGLLIIIVTVFFVGLLFQFNPISWLYDQVEKALLRMPVIKTLYGSVRDFANMFDKNKPKAQKVVLVDMPDTGIVTGFITSENVPEAVREACGDDLVPVYLPMSYMIGGYTVFLRRDQLTEVDWPVEDAMRFALTAGVSQHISQERKPEFILPIGEPQEIPK